MAVIAVCAAKGSPGATVTSLAFALTWDRRLILAECDPAGGDIAAGYLREVALDGRSIGRLTAMMARRRLTEDWWTQLVDLAPGKDTAMTRLVLPGLIEPTQASGLSAGWDQLAHLFRGLEDADTGYDVIADCGRLVTPYPPTPILGTADLVLLVLRPTLPSIRSAAAALNTLTRIGATQVGLVLSGAGDYSAKEIGLELRSTVLAELPDDPATAAVLTSGGERHRGRLLRAAARAETVIWQSIAEARAARERPAARPLAATEVSHAR